jgi:hypothetical protein
MWGKLAVTIALAAAVMASDVRADELIESDWIEIKPSELDRDHAYENISYFSIDIDENRSFHTDALTVISLKFKAKNNAEEDLFFDLDLIALDESDTVLFVMNFSPALAGIGPGSTAFLSQSRYVEPGTLERVAKYRFRFIGIKDAKKP